MAASQVGDGRPEALGWTEIVASLDALAGRRIAARVVRAGPPEELVLIAHGVLGKRSQSKQPSAFWPLEVETSTSLEAPGLYLRADEVTAVQRRAGGILVIAQSDVIVNIRPLEEPHAA
jgi:hypothetical protein